MTDTYTIEDIGPLLKKIDHLNVVNKELVEALKDGEELLSVICEVICFNNPPPHGIERLNKMRDALSKAGAL